jgi:hypothetical protein
MYLVLSIFLCVHFLPTDGVVCLVNIGATSMGF